MGTGVPDWKQVAEESGFRQRGICQLCAMPEEIREQAHDAWGHGMRAQFLKNVYFPAVGYLNVSASSIQHHFENDHQGGK